MLVYGIMAIELKQMMMMMKNMNKELIRKNEVTEHHDHVDHGYLFGNRTKKQKAEFLFYFGFFILFCKWNETIIIFDFIKKI